MSIQQGEHPVVIREKMLSSFGEEYINQYESTLGKHPQSHQSVDSNIEEIKDTPAYSDYFYSERF